MKFFLNYDREIKTGLFHRVICQSGSALCHFAQISNYSDKLMDLLNINTRSEEVVLQNLLTLPVEKLLEIQDAIVSCFALFS